MRRSMATSLICERSWPIRSKRRSKAALKTLPTSCYGEPNNAVYVTGIVHKVAMAVGEKVPYHLEIVQPKVPLVRAGTMNLKVVVTARCRLRRAADGAVPIQSAGRWCGRCDHDRKG